MSTENYNMQWINTTLHYYLCILKDKNCWTVGVGEGGWWPDIYKTEPKYEVQHDTTVTQNKIWKNWIIIVNFMGHFEFKLCFDLGINKNFDCIFTVFRPTFSASYSSTYSVLSSSGKSRHICPIIFPISHSFNSGFWAFTWSQTLRL